MDTENTVSPSVSAHNPFDSTQPVPPFAGRAEQFARLHQHLTSAAVPHALTLLGRRHSGRTAFIEAARRRFNESFVWTTPDTAALGSHSQWLAALYQAGKDAASVRGLSVHRLPRWPDEKPAAEQRTWLAEVGLPELYQLIRPHRRLIFVMDGVVPLAAAVEKGILPDDTGAWLSSIIGPQLGFVFTDHIDNEQQLARLSPLIDAETTLRLGALSESEIKELLDVGRGDFEESLPAQLHRLTGGLPEMTLAAAAAIHEISRGEAYNGGHLKQARPALTAASIAYFRELWGNLTADEQAALTALAYLRFARPDAVINAEDVEAWLADSDYPLDLTAIFSVLRRLEFLEIVRGTHKDIIIRAGLFESYIRDTVKPESLRRGGGRTAFAAIDPLLLRYGVGVLAALLVLLVIFALVNTPGGDAADAIVPTLALGQ